MGRDRGEGVIPPHAAMRVEHVLEDIAGIGTVGSGQIGPHIAPLIEQAVTLAQIDRQARPDPGRGGRSGDARLIEYLAINGALFPAVGRSVPRPVRGTLSASVFGTPGFAG